MKILLPSFTMVLFPMNKMLLHLLTSSFILMLLLKFNTSTNTTFNLLFSMDQISLSLILLSLMSMLLILISSDQWKKIKFIMILINSILLITFSSHNIMLFYIMFELILIPTMILITKNGKQPERLQAGIYLIMYTIISSIPLLMSILIMKNSSFHLNFILYSKSMLLLPMMMAFLVKLPMFSIHLWLPKAHVEAPLEGSMILAAILLKLGGYGIIRFMPLLTNLLKNSNHWFISISMTGAFITGLNCFRQKDMKSLIAYSSVAHMGFVLSSMMTMNYISIKGSLMMMMAHGLSSSALFFLVNEIYQKYHTRSIILMKGLLSTSPNMSFWWFLFMAANISAPPSINIISEILMLTSMMNWNLITMIPFALASLSTALFSMILFNNIYHNNPSSLNSSSKNSNHKSFNSLMIHLTPMLILTMKMETML